MEVKTVDRASYHAYLLRVWSESDQERRPTWRFVLVDSQTGKQHGFHSLDALVDYLRLLTEGSSEV